MPLVKEKDLWGNPRSPITRNREQFFDTESIISAICTELYPEFHVMKASSDNNGVFLCPYLSSSGIRVGDVVSVSISNGIPVATRHISFGFSPKNIIVCNLEPKDDEKNLDILDKETPWSKDDGEPIGFEPIYIKHKEGEKVFNVNTNGLLLGYSDTTLFATPFSKLKLTRDDAILSSSDINIVSKASNRVSRDIKGKKYVSDTTYKNTADGGIFGVVHKLSGDIYTATQSLGINSITIMGIPLTFANFISLEVILDENLEEYKTSTTFVSHSYVNRKVKIHGNKRATRVVNQYLKGEVGIGDKGEYRSGIATIGEEVYPVVYVRGISKKGDIYEFSAGEKHIVTTEESIIRLGDRKEVSLGHSTIKHQRGEIKQHFPISENDASSLEYYGSTTHMYKGKVFSSIDDRSHNVRINETCIFEEDKESGIPTNYTVISPKIVTSTVDYSVLPSSEYSSDFSPKLFFSSTGETQDILSITPNGRGLMFDSIDKDKKTSLVVSSNYAEVVTSGQMRIKGKTLAVDNELSVFNGVVMLNEGLRAKKIFELETDNIILNAKENFYMKAKIFNATFDTGVISYLDRLVWYATEGEINKESKLQKQGSIIEMLPSSIILSSEQSTLYGKETVVVAAENRATLSSLSTTISGWAG